MGKIRSLDSRLEVVACSRDECRREMDDLRRRLELSIALIAEFHDRSRMLWGSEVRYTDSDLWAKAKKRLAEG